MTDAERIATMRAEREAAFLTLDEALLRAFAAKYRVYVPADPEAFWAGVHKTRAGLTSLPREVRVASKLWLEAHGYQLAPGTTGL